MAVPAMTANSPTSGSIAWGAFTIQYGGVGYAIAAGNTSERWVWWRYNGGGANTAIEAGPEVPQDLTDDDLVLFSNRKGTPVRVQSASLLDGDLIVDGSVVTKALDSECVTSDVVKTGSLTGDLFVSKVSLSSTFSTGVIDETTNQIVGARCELGPDGFYTIDANNNPLVKFPLSAEDDAYVQAHFDMLSADVEDNFTMRGTNNQIAAEAELTLAAGVEAPTAPPNVSVTYDQVQFDTQTACGPWDPNVPSSENLGVFALNPSQITSITWDPNYQAYAVCQQKSNGARVWRFKADGSLAVESTTGKPACEDFVGYENTTICYSPERNQIVRMFAYSNGANWYVSWTGMINDVPASWILDDPTKGRYPIIGWDAVGAKYTITQNDGGATGNINVRRFTLNGAQYGNLVASGSPWVGPAKSGINRRINGMVYGQQVKAGTSTYAVSVDDYSTTYVFDTAGVQKNTDGADWQWLREPTLGFCHDGSQFCTVDPNGLMTKYTSWTWDELNNTAYIGASAYDSDTTGGTHETPVGTLVSFFQRKRAKLQITMPETNDSGGIDDPDKWKLYYCRKTSTPTKTDLKYVDMIGSPTAPTSKTIQSDPTGANPPGGIKGQSGAVNTFPGADPGRIESSASDAIGPLISLLGNGSGRTGPLAWGTDGKVSKTPIPLGAMLDFGGQDAKVPSDFLLCNGAAVSRTTYAGLFAVMGTLFGPGDGSTTFNLPDTRIRHTIGAAEGSGWTRSLVGAHETNDVAGTAPGPGDSGRLRHNHTHTISGQSGAGGVQRNNSSVSGTSVALYSDYNGHAHGGNTGSSGVGPNDTSNIAYHAFLVVNKIVKAVL